jgi:hypothetical protein
MRYRVEQGRRVTEHALCSLSCRLPAGGTAAGKAQIFALTHQKRKLATHSPQLQGLAQEGLSSPFDARHEGVPEIREIPTVSHHFIRINPSGSRSQRAGA